MSDAVSPVDGMDWGAGGVEEGTEEAADVKIALINAVLTQDGAGAANEGESEASRLWRLRGFSFGLAAAAPAGVAGAPPASHGMW